MTSESRQSESDGSEHSIKWWVWTQHGDAEYMWTGENTAKGAVEQFCTSRRVPFGTSIYAVRADEVLPFVVGAEPRP